MSPPPVDRWAELGDREHLVQFYEDSQTLVETLTGFIGSGLRAGGAGVVIASPAHLEALEQQLAADGIDVAAAKKSGQYVGLDAGETLATIVSNHWPQPELFDSKVGNVIRKARSRWGSVRAYGEMVGLLWESGGQGAALRLEGLWNDLARNDPFALLCGYHVNQLRVGDRGRIGDICASHGAAAINDGDPQPVADADERARLVARLERRVQRLEGELDRRKLLEAQLAEREMELTDFLENAVVSLHKVDANGIVSWANRAELDLLGYEPAEYIGRPIADFVVQSGQAAALLARVRAGETLRDEHVQMRCKNGSAKDVVINSSPLVVDGKFICTRSSMRDVTAQWSIEQRVADRTSDLRRSELQFKELVSGVVDYAIYMLDTEGYIASWNAGAERIKGYSRSEAIGKHFSMFYTREDQEKGVPRRALTTAATLGKYEAEAWRVRKDGNRFWASVVIDAIYNESGAHIGFAKVTRDLTERRMIEEQLRQAQKMEAIGQLTGGVAHDFNNLLTVIVGNLETIWRSAPADDGKLRRAIDQVTRGAQRAVTLTQQLLAFSRRQPLNPKPTDINRLVAGMSDMVRRTIGENIAVETVLAGGLWRVEIDAHQLESALLNLAVNARDVMQDGGKLTIETANAHLDDGYTDQYPELKPGQYVVLCVTDTGTGMTPEVIARAFEPFYTTKPIGQGTGLGLSQVYGFVKQSGGHVRLYSEVGHGTTVKIYLPRMSGQRDEEQEANIAVPLRGGLHEVVLVVEDDNDVRLFTTESLRELGFTVLEARDGPSALKQLERHPEVQLLFTDVGLPGINGAQLVAAAREQRPDIKVLFTTGYARNAIVHQGRLDAGVKLITKPFTRSQLAARIRDVLDAPVVSSRKPVVLVIEDEALVRMFILDQLQDLGFEVLDAGSAAEGLRAARSHQQVDVAIVDRGLPDRDGLEVVAELRTQLPQLPVIVASGYGELPDHAALRNDPHIRFMSKPYDIDGLTTALRGLHVRTKEMG
ncbi:MAG TPA: response regulator [Steroidobacteraceae bacterium]|nr:response regulator [Steroidobacteraceae bacterium]